MKETEFKALIRLLDDEDPGVEAHVKEKLLSLGQEGIPKLEMEWEQTEDEFVQGRIADIIHIIQTQDISDLLVEWCQQGGRSLLRGWFLVTQFHFPELDFVQFKNEISRLVNRIWLELRSHMNLPEKLRTVNRLLFNNEVYRGTSAKKLKVDSFLLNRVIDTKRGSPLGLGLLYLIICEELELPVQGILLPNYFILTHQAGENEFFIDPYHKGTFFLRTDLERSLKQRKIQDDPKYYKPSGKLPIIRALIRSLIRLHQQGGSEDKVKSLRLLLEKIEED
ncbi:MAG: transglutaminase family protein [Bacteroidota bacterium]